MTEQFANNATTTLNGGINNSTTSVVVLNGSPFSSSGNFRIIIDSEIMLVTNVSGNTFTVTRGSESTVAVAHNSGATVTQIVTAAAIQTCQTTLGTWSNRPSAGNAGRRYIPSDQGFECIDDGTNWRPVVEGMLMTSPPTVAGGGWTWVNQAGSSVSQAQDSVYISSPAGAGLVYYMRTGTGSSTASIEAASLNENSGTTSSGSAQFPFRGIAMLESSTGKGLIMIHGPNTSTNQYEFYIFVAPISGTAGSSQNQTSPQNNYWQTDPMGITFMRIRLSGSNIIAEYSKTRTNWTQLQSLSISSVFTSGPNQAGLLVSAASSGVTTNINFFHMIQT